MFKPATATRLMHPVIIVLIFLCAAGSVSAQYVENQSASAQTADYWITGKGSLESGLSVGSVYNTTNTSPGYYSTYKSQFWGPITIEGNATSQVRFTGFNTSSPGFVFDGSLSKTTMYLLASQNLLTQTDGSTVINGNKLVFQGAASISPYQQPLAITRSYPGVGGNATLVLDNDVLGAPPAPAGYKILQAKYSGTEVFYVQGNGVASFSADAVVNGVAIGKGGGNLTDNTAVGVQALAANTAGIRNTAFGYNALSSNTTTSYNTAIGSHTLRLNTSGASNTAVGYASLRNNTGGSFNTAMGENAMAANTTGTFNTAIGRSALVNATTAFYNTAIGYSSQYYTSTGEYNTSIGALSLYYNTVGANNTVNGYRALYNNTGGNQNISVGSSSLYLNTTGSYNTAVGMSALYSNVSGVNNTAIGLDAIRNIATASNNVAIGNCAGSNLTAGDNNIFIGYYVQPNVSTTASNQLNIGNWIYGNNGNIGIGVTNPSARLHSNGTVRLEGLTTNNALTNILAADASGNVSWRDASTLGGGGSSQWTTVVNDIYYNTGNVGIGASAPSAKLHINGSVRLEGLTNNNALTQILASDASGNVSWRDASTLGSGGGNWILSGSDIYNSNMGLVTIGTSTNPSPGDANLKLAVNGNIYAKKVKVTQAGWADYVFDPQYKLPTLKEVETFIQQNKHLPDVPSAAEVEKNGLDLGDNQAVLLKKIEELTLYMIEMNKKVEKLEEENTVLKKKLRYLNK